MEEHNIKQRYSLGQIVAFNGREHRISAFRYEIRPMGVFKVYEVSDENGITVDTVEHVLEIQNGVCACTDECLSINHKDAQCKKLKGWNH